MSTNTIETLNNRVTVRKFTNQPIDHETVTMLINAARRSPTSSNMQTYSIIVVRDQEKKKKIAALANNQKHIEACPVFFAFCADVSRIKLASKMNDIDFTGNLESTLVATIDASLVGMSLSLSAESMGLGTVMIGAIRNNPIEAAELLGLPNGSYIVFGLCVGWPESVPPQKPRLPETLVVHQETYNTDEAQTTNLMQKHDKELAEHYRSLNRNTPDAAWTGTAADRHNPLRRPQLRQQLETLGFIFD